MSSTRVTWAPIPAPIGTGHARGYTSGGPGARVFPGFSTRMAARHRQRIYKDNILGVTKPSIRRLARRGGVRRMRAEIYDSTRAILKTYLQDVLSEVCHVVSLCRRKTIKTTDIIYVLKRRGQTLYGFDEFRVQRRSGKH